MTVRKIEIGCNTVNCYAHFGVETATIEAARTRAAERWGWTYLPDADQDICAPCQRGDTPDQREHVREAVTPKEVGSLLVACSCGVTYTVPLDDEDPPGTETEVLDSARNRHIDSWNARRSRAARP